ncbi:hypothetical protein IscW_ISCW016942 [Ixodes scapularis]|uniref:EB domain-containing protein n=1 Tax=Ixodes scapularis TaxID=6945 RepID=B7PDH6_IXOSC|nr:hypothetical protein IscW_ISCW016942 [Ixodes scapularis]|eukprot:XP_002410810.1 hypothetical protein IscW_ISCW016942 [Ixodes scapularis]
MLLGGLLGVIVLTNFQRASGKAAARSIPKSRKTTYDLLKSEPCNTDQTCSLRDPESRCLEQFCVCQPGFTDVSGDRCKKLVQLGDVCTENHVCAGDAIQCVDERCICERGFNENEGACLKTDPARATSKLVLYIVGVATLIFIVGGVSSMLYTQIRQRHIKDQACDNCFLVQCTIL